MTILTIPQLELLIFLKSPMIPEWILESSGDGLGFVYYGLGYEDGAGHGDGFEYGSGISSWKAL